MMIFPAWIMMILEEGKQSNHKKFGEATAILAGDALHDFAFQLISENLKNINPNKI